MANSLLRVRKAAGLYYDAEFHSHTFLLSDNHFTTLDYPGTLSPDGLTEASGANNEGDVVCHWSADGVTAEGFLYHKGEFAAQSFPGASSSGTRGINGRGQMIGLYTDNSGTDHGFLLNRGVYTSFDFPNSTFTDRVYSINNAGLVVGAYGDTNGNSRGFVALALTAGRDR